MSNEEKCTVTDRVQQQIEDLILAASDPKDKAFLLIMNKIAASLDTNTTLTQELSNEFKAHSDAFKLHESRESRILNKSRGGVLVGLYMLGIIQVLVGFVVSDQLAELKSLRKDLTEIGRSVLVHTEQLKNLQRPASP